jgi:hypothetical protein
MLKPYVEIFVAVALGVISAVTLVWPDWIELVFGADPDGGNGGAEWGVVLGFAAAALIVGLLARRDFRRAALDAASAPSAKR